MRNRTVRLGVASAAAVVVTCTPSMGGAAPEKSSAGEQHDTSDSQKKPAAAAPKTDFDNDGHEDLAAASPKGSLGGDEDGLDDPGYVTVTYGASSGPDTKHTEVLNKKSDVMPKGISNTDGFGSSIVARDFDGDGYTDLAIGVRKKNDDADYTSEVVLVFGSKDGFTDGTWLKGGSRDENDDQLAAGDFTGDDTADLVVSLGTKDGLLKGPFTRDGAPASTGAVPSGTHPDNVTNDLVAGDLTGDGVDDLVATQEHGPYGNQPALVLKGGGGGLTEAPDGKLPEGDAAVIGDVDKDGHGDLVVERAAKPEGPEHSSRIEVVYGDENGLSDRHDVLDQDSKGIPGKKKQKDNEWGSALDVGDTDGDGYADVAVGNPGEKVDGEYHAGSVTLLKGGPRGLSGEDARSFDVATDGIAGKPQDSVKFGLDVALRDLDSDGHKDLATGAPDMNGHGRVHVLPGTKNGVTAHGTTSFTAKDVSGLPKNEELFSLDMARFAR